MSRKHTEQVHFRLPLEEKNLLREKATEARMTMSEYILTLTKKKKIIVVDSLPKLILEITRIGVNINQVATVANSTRAVNSFQLEMLCGELDKVEKILARILREFYGDDSNGSC